MPVSCLINYLSICLSIYKNKNIYDMTMIMTMIMTMTMTTK